MALKSSTDSSEKKGPKTLPRLRGMFICPSVLRQLDFGDTRVSLMDLYELSDLLSPGTKFQKLIPHDAGQMRFKEEDRFLFGM